MLRSWVPGADGSGFPAEHLPYGVFAERDGLASGAYPRIGVRIGDQVVDLAQLAADGLIDGAGEPPGLAPRVFDQATLNPFMAEGPARWRAVRERLTELLCDPRASGRVGPALRPVGQVELFKPFTVADYVDCYSSLEHATNLGRLFRPDGDPLLPNWRHLPVAYHGRAGTTIVSGTPVVRPHGQRRSPEGEVVFGPTTRLDIELEVGFVVGVASAPTIPVPVDSVPAHVFGVVLVNDWSARDIQAWEYQPLGPFLGKSFATSLAAWVTPLAALEACRRPGPVQDPAPLPYLALDQPWALDIDLAVDLEPAGGTGVETISSTSFAGLYWRFPQQIAHMTSNGAHLRTGDLVASGTVSGPERGSEGSLVELTRAGAEPISVAGVARSFLEDGDQVVLRGRATVADGVTITLGEVQGQVLPAW